MKDNIDDLNLDIHICHLQAVLFTISKVISHLHKRSKSDFFLRKKLLTLAEKNPDNKQHYKYTMSFVNTNVHECENIMKRAISLNADLCQLTATCRGSIECVSVHGRVDIGNHPCLFRLLPCHELEKFLDLSLDPSLIKQGSDLWLQYGKKACITGSTLHKALGLEKLKDHKEHFEVFIRKCRELPVSSKVRDYMEYGRENEVNRLATVLASLMPTLCPPCHTLIEVVPMFIHRPDVDNFIEVSPDGLITCQEGDNCGYKHFHLSGGCIALKIKCKYPKAGEPDNPWQEVPVRVIPQCLAEMAVLSMEMLWLLCYTKNSSSLFYVYFNQDLWDNIIEACQLFYG